MTVVFLAARVPGTIEWVDEDLHRVGVLTEEGEEISFALNRKLARFVAEEHPAGPRLAFGSNEASDAHG